MSHIFKFELGEVLKEKVTGFIGVAMVRAEYFTNCDHYGLCSRELKDGKPVEWEWFDETRLVIVKGEERVLRESRAVPTSGSFPSGPQV